MKKTAGMLIASAMLAGTAYADSDDVDAETVAAIEAKLAEMECQMDPDDIEVKDDGYELDDVICSKAGQFDIMLDADLNETARKAE